jgi:hypothetical protein
MRKYILAAAAAVLALAVGAQQPQQCLAPHLINGLVFLGRTDMTVSVARWQAAFMGSAKLPAQLVLIGAGTRANGLTAVAYKTSLAPEKAHAAVIEALKAEGWTLEAPAVAATFRVAGTAPRQETLCRDAERRGVMVKDAANVRYINVVALPEARRRECNEAQFMAGASLRGAMPRFQFPEGTSPAMGFGGGAGSDTSFTTSSRIVSPEAAASLVKHLAGQLEKQGWQPDSSWSGSVSAGSTWRRLQDGDVASGTLEVVRVTDHTYDVDFTLALPQ